MKWIALAFLLVACGESKKPVEYGSIHGNAYWKYNNYVGNKPDAGSSVKAINLEDTSFHYETTADLRGDYQLDSIATGKYLVIVTSKNTYASDFDMFSNVALYRKFIGDAIGYKFPEDSSLIVKAFRCDSIRSRALLDERKYSKVAKYRDSANILGEKWLSLIPREQKKKFSLYGGNSKIDFSIVTVKPKRTETVISDFGITYF